MQTIADLPAQQLAALDAYSSENKVSRAEAVRRAVVAFLPEKPRKNLSLRDHPAVGGSWKDRGVDAVEYQRKLRAEWDHRS